MTRMRIMVSGGFDPLHIGHIRMIEAAAKYGKVIVALNSDDWLTRKKGKPFMKFDERAEILESLASVHLVTEVDDSDGTVCKALRRYVPHFFGNGGDRTTANPLEDAVCKEIGIRQIFHLGGYKVQSSSALCATR